MLGAIGTWGSLGAIGYDCRPCPGSVLREERWIAAEAHRDACAFHATCDIERHKMLASDCVEFLIEKMMVEKKNERGMVPSAQKTAAYQWRRNNIGRLLNMAVKRFEKRVLELMAEAGYGDFTLSQMTITRNLDVHGTRATELARRADITKQSVGELIGQLEEIGLIERIQDPDDKRARIVHFTAAGLAWLDAFEIAVKQAEKEMREEQGAATFKLLKQGLTQYGSDEKNLE